MVALRDNPLRLPRSLFRPTLSLRFTGLAPRLRQKFRLYVSDWRANTTPLPVFATLYVRCQMS
jgi:hypothetical protein